jgi:hypothetical protein
LTKEAPPFAGVGQTLNREGDGGEVGRPPCVTEPKETLRITSPLGIPNDLGPRQKSRKKVEHETEGVGPGEDRKDAGVLKREVGKVARDDGEHVAI